jgi:hypothetical protein
MNTNQRGLCLLNFFTFLALLLSAGVAHADIDVNKDGLPDLLFQNQANNNIAYWAFDSAHYLGGAALQSPISADWKLIDSADMNGDDKADLIYQNATTGQVVIWYMDGGTMVGGGALSLLPAPGYKVVGSGDFNGDGFTDLVFQETGTGKIAFWFQNGLMVTGGVNPSGLSTPLDPNNQVVGVADFNGDGTPDLVFQNRSTRAISFWAMQKTGVVGSATLPLIPAAGYEVAGLGDFNGDGSPDLLFQSATTGQLVYWLLNSTTYSGGGTLPTAASLSWHVTGGRSFDLRFHSPTSYPIGVTGFNRDVIFENSLSTSATPFDDETTTYIADGFQGKAGLPSGVFPSRLPNAVTGATTRYQLQPFDANNVLMIEAADVQGTLTLVAPHAFRTLSIAAASSNARFVSGDSTLILNFQDGSTSAAINYHARDWWGEGQNNDPNRILAAGVSRTTNVGLHIPSSTVQIDTIYTKFNLYETTLDLSNIDGVDYTHKRLQSITFRVANGAERTGIFAVSGVIARP